MIKANELRIGNLILPRTGTEEYVKVTDIDEYGNIGTEAYFWDGAGSTGTTSEIARGIPLTPEWLDKLGFSLERVPDEVDDEGDIIPGYTHWTNGKCCFHFKDGKIEAREHISSVHMFQNWYYFNHNEELQIITI